MIATSGFSASTLFELGGALLQSGHPGWAILEYERAQALAPRDPVVEQALVGARTRAGVGPPPVGAWGRVIGQLTDDAWAWIAATSVLALCTGLAWLRRPAVTGAWARGLVLAGVCGACLAADAIALRWQELDRAVVVGPAAARIAPAANAETTFELREGELVYLQDRFNGFERVRAPDGRDGWLSGRQVVPVLVSSSEAAAEDLPAP